MKDEKPDERLNRVRNVRERPPSAIPTYKIRGAYTTSSTDYGSISFASSDVRRTHCERSALSEQADVKWYALEGIRLLDLKEHALRVGSKDEVAEASASCERHFQEWEDKDLAEADADRGVKDRSQRQEQARAATKAREERRGDWRSKAETIDDALLDTDPEMPLKARAEAIAARLSLSERTVADYLYSTTARRQSSR